MEIDIIDVIFRVAAGALRSVLGLVSPLIIGLVAAYLLWPMVAFFEAKLKNRAAAMAASYLLVGATLVGIIYGFVVLILGSMPRGGVRQVWPQIAAYFEGALADLAAFAEERLGLAVGEISAGDLFSALFRSGFSGSLATGLSPDSAAKIISSITDTSVDFFLGVVASIYLLKDKEYFLRLWQQFLSLVTKQKTHGLICETMSEIQSVMSTFLRAAFLDSFIVAFLCSLVLTFAEVRFAVVIGVLCGILNIIPYFGPFFSMVPAFVTAFFQEAGVGAGLARGALAVLAVFVVQQADANFIYPRLVGTSVGLHPLFVLLSLSVMGYLGGVLGMVLAVPAAGVLQVLVRRWAEGRR